MHVFIFDGNFAIHFARNDIVSLFPHESKFYTQLTLKI